MRYDSLKVTFMTFPHKLTITTNNVESDIDLREHQ